MERVVHAPAFPSLHRWPVEVRYDQIALTPFRPGNHEELDAVRSRNQAWLAPWDATPPAPTKAPVSAHVGARVRWDQARRGTSLPWILRLATKASPAIGQVTVSNIVYGSALFASMGYWIDRKYAGFSIMPVAVALATDYCFITLGLHRMEICIRKENRASLRVVEKLGFHYEGRRPKYIHIAGDWRDHEVFALYSEEVPSGVLSRVAPLTLR